MVWLTDGKFSEEYFNYLEAKIININILINTNDFYKE